VISPRLVQLIAERDFWAIVKTKSFLIGLAAFGFIACIMPAVALLSLIEPHYKVVVVDLSGRYEEPLREHFDKSEKLTLVEVEDKYSIEAASGDVSDAMYSQLYGMVRTKEVDGLIFIWNNATSEPGQEQFILTTANLADPNLQGDMEKELTRLQRTERAKALGISEENLASLMKPAKFRLERVNEKSEVKQVDPLDSVVAIFIPVVMVFVLYGLISFQSERLLTALMEEKMKRLLEVLLTRVNIYELLAGKMLGILYVGLLLYGGVLGLLLVTAIWVGFLHLISAKVVVFFTLFYAAGYMLYASFYAAIGAACSHPKDAENLSMPLRMLLVVPIMISVYVNIHPNAEASILFAYFPLTAPFVMTNRMMVLQVPEWQLALSLLLVLVAAAFGLWAATRIFQASLLAGSRTLGPKEVLRSLRFK